MSDEYVRHPRYGAEPRYTGFDPDPNSENVFLHWNTNILTTAQRRTLEKLYGDSDFEPGDGSEAIRGTAIVADVTRQIRATVQVTHYYDIRKICRDCSSWFIFFADEQKYWYETLQFPLEANCVRCFPCRKKTNELQKIRARYEELCSIAFKSADQNAEQAECRLTLIEEGIFHRRQLEQVRAFLNSYPDHLKAGKIKERIAQIEHSENNKSD